MSLYKKILYVQCIILISLILDLLWAFPIKWAWNYVMPYLFDLPVLNWGKAFCLIFVLTTLWKISVIDTSKANIEK